MRRRRAAARAWSGRVGVGFEGRTENLLDFGVEGKSVASDLNACAFKRRLVSEPGSRVGQSLGCAGVEVPVPCQWALQ